MTKKELDARINHFMLFIVENADKPYVYLDYVRHLADRHKIYGIRAHQFDFVSETNIKTLRLLLGSQLSNEDEKAWRDGFKCLSFLMKIRGGFK
jgi:hemoglobin-like flavoprotein